MPLHLQTEAASSFMTLPTGTDQFLFLNPANNKFSAINAASQIVSIGGVVSTGTVATSGFAIYADATGGTIQSLGTIIPVAMGGTGSNTQNFVDLSNTQTVGGAKTFSTPPALSGANITAGTVPNAALVTPPVTSVGSGTNITSSGGTAPTISFSGVLPIGSGGTGSSTQNFVDLSNTQTVGGAKTFSTAPSMSGANITSGTIPNAALVTPDVLTVTGSGNIASSGGQNPVITFTGTLPIANGGTGSTSQNFVDLSNTQTIGGAKTFSTAPVASGANITTNTIPLASLVQLPANTFLGNIGAVGNVESLTGTQATSLLNNATTSVPGLLAATDKLFLQNYENSTIVLVTANQYQNLACDGVTNDATAFNALLAAVPNNSRLVWPNCTMMFGSAVTIPAGKHLYFQGVGFGKTIWQSNSFTTDFMTCADWYQTFDGILFQANTTTASAAGTVSTASSTISITSNTNIPSGAGTCYIATTANTWQLVSFTGSTSTSLTGCTTASGSFPYSNGAQITFKTGGYGINGSTMNYIVAKNCQFSYVYNGVYHGGTICQISDSYFFGTVNFDMQFNNNNVNSIVHNVTCDGAPPAVAHLEVNNCGSLLISDCDIIRATNNMRLNPTSPNGVFGVYTVNTYYDTPMGSSVKLMGTGNIQRVKFVNTWLSSSTTGSGLECASTAATLPTAIDLTNCDIYGNNQSGILVNGCQDIAVSNSRIAGNAVAGITMNASTGTVTSLRANDNRIGPTGGLGANGVGVSIAAGAYNTLELYQNNIIGNTGVSIADLSTSAIARLYNNNIGAPISGVPTISVPPLSTVISTTETVLCTAYCGTGILPGTSFRIRIYGACTASAANNSTLTLRFGTAGTTADASIATGVITSAATGTSIPFVLNIYVTVRAIGTTSTVTGYLDIQNGTSATTGITGLVVAQTYVSFLATSATLNTTLNGILSLSYKSAATTTACSFQGAHIEVLGNAA